MKTINMRALLLGIAGGAVVAAVLMVGTAAAGRTAAAKVSTAKTPLGRILVDSRGRTLYLFEKDGKTSMCSGQCASYWPPLTTTGKPLAASGVSAKLLGTIKRAGGKLQVTYAGHPLYTFAVDKAKGQTKGEGMSAFGAEWYVLGTNGSKIEKESSSTPPPANNGGYGGYGS